VFFIFGNRASKIMPDVPFFLMIGVVACKRNSQNLQAVTDSSLFLTTPLFIYISINYKNDSLLKIV